MHKKVEGYFTVEAALVMPIMLGAIVFVIYFLFFQYNRCLMEQDIGVLTMRGAALQADNNQDRIAKLRDQADNLYAEKYIMWEREEISMGVKQGKLTMGQKGGEIWKAETYYKNHIISPISFVRTYRKLRGE